jgi:hypothetical protein
VFTDEAVPIRSGGGPTRADARISSDKECENHSRRKSKGSWAR